MKNCLTKYIYISCDQIPSIFSPIKLTTLFFILIAQTTFAQLDTIFEMTPPPSLTLDGQSINEGDFTLNSYSMFDSLLTETIFEDIIAVGGTGATFHAIIGSTITHKFTSTTEYFDTMIITKFSFTFDATDPNLPPINSSVVTSAPSFTVNLPNSTGENFHQAINENETLMTSNQEFTLATSSVGAIQSLDLYPTTNPGVLFAITMGGLPPSGSGQGHGGGGLPPLPVELTNFNGKLEERIVHLYWETIMEKNNEGFSIEHSTDEFKWQTVGFVKGKGDSYNKQNYDFYHEYFKKGINYYRLKQTDFNGQYNYSNILSIEAKTGYPIPLQVQPTPTRDHVTLSYHSKNKGKINLQLYSSDGIMLMLQELHIDKGMNLIPLNLNDYHSGLYTVVIKNLMESGLVTEKIIKL